MSTAFDRERVRKIIVVRNDNLGDVICTAPAIEALRRAFPEAFIAALVADYTRDALEGNPYLDRVYSYVKAKHSSGGRVGAWLRQAGVVREIRASGFDLAIGIRSRFTRSNAWLAYASGAPMRLGHAPGPRDARWPYGRYFNIFAPDETTEVHEVERALNVVRAIGVDIDEKRLFLHVPGDEIERADAFINAYALKRARPLVCVHVTSRPEHGRVWPVGHYVGLIDALHASGRFDVVMNWMASEDGAASEIMTAVRKKPPVFKAGGLKSFAAFLKRSDMLVTLEGGAMHIGAAAGTRVLAIFARTSTVTWAPWGRGHITLQNGPDAASITAHEVARAVDAAFSATGAKVLEFRR